MFIILFTVRIQGAEFTYMVTSDEWRELLRYKNDVALQRAAANSHTAELWGV